MQTPRKHPVWLRLTVALGVPAVILLALYYIMFVGSGLKCVFYEISGLYCPGCGSGRAVSAILQGRWAEAFGHNILLLPLGIPAAVVFVHEYLRISFPGLNLRPVSVSSRLETSIVVLIFAFWILRNIPSFSTRPESQQAAPVQVNYTNNYTPVQPPVPMSTGGLMAWSIITLHLCTIPGIVAIVKTSQINKAASYDEQQAAAKSARTWCIVGTILGILAVIGSVMGS